VAGPAFTRSEPEEPEVLTVCQTVQAGPKLMTPVPLELIDQLGVPVHSHLQTLMGHCGFHEVLSQPVEAEAAAFPGDARSAFQLAWP
jgi:hypothetical protein